MHEIFDLSRIKKLVETEHPSAALIIDIGILMDVPELNLWKTSLDKPLFILPSLMPRELEHQKNNRQTGRNACAACDELIELCRNKCLSEGIYRDRIGWFIGTPLPEKEPLEAELTQLELIVKTFGQLTTRLIIVARELQRDLPGIPSVLLTKNAGLNHALQFIGINSALFQGFPISSLEEAFTGSDSCKLNWDEVLREIQLKEDKKLMQVELCLLSRAAAPGWINGVEQTRGSNRLLIAQGTGVIHASTDIHFRWTLPYLAWDFPEINYTTGIVQPDSHEKMISPGRAYLDFESADFPVSPVLRKALIDKIGNCASPMSYIEDMPTIQEPLSVIKQFLIFEYAFSERKKHGDLDRSALEDFENKLHHTDNLLNWAYYWLRDRQVDAEEVNVSLSEFLHAVKSCWSIGETCKFTLLDHPAEIGRFREETGDEGGTR